MSDSASLDNVFDLRLLEGANHHIPIRSGDGVVVFLRNFLIRDEYFPCRAVIAQIAQMNQQGQHIISRLEAGHVIAECLCINGLPIPGQEFYDRVSKPIKIHSDIDLSYFMEDIPIIPLKSPSPRNEDYRFLLLHGRNTHHTISGIPRSCGHILDRGF